MRLGGPLGLLAIALAACAERPQAVHSETTPLVSQVAAQDIALWVCKNRIAAAESAQQLPGSPQLSANRVAVLGRAVGEPVVFVAPPGAPELTPPAPRKRENMTRWLLRVKRFYGRNRVDLRRALLRDGYLYDADPLRANALVRWLSLTDLFNEPTIWLQRGWRKHRLERKRAVYRRGHDYYFSEGPEKGRIAKLLWSDRVAIDKSALAKPLHRDVRALRDEVGFERIEILQRTADALVVRLRFGKRWLRALLEADGAKLELACLDAERAERAEVATYAQGRAPRRQAVLSLQATIDQMVAERLPFDRPRRTKDHLSDGHLRPQWEWAYKQGQQGFRYRDESYPVFDYLGRPRPPQMCVSLVLDTYERAAGNWYGKRKQPRSRSAGRLDFDKYGMVNRAGVLAFEKFAASQPELFTTRRIPDSERIPFRDRDAFFAYLASHADDFSPGDVVAIQGRKRDGFIHQHAILIEDVDPVTGFAYRLVDQMSLPRRRSWEGIMAEAPLRSLLYQVRPQPALMQTFATRASAGALVSTGAATSATR